MEQWKNRVKENKHKKSILSCIAVMCVTSYLLIRFWMMSANGMDLPYVLITLLLFMSYIIIMLRLKDIHTERKMIASVAFFAITINMTIYHAHATGEFAIDGLSSFYNALLLMIGEYNGIYSSNEIFNTWHNIGRFLALSVLYGSLIVIFLRKQIRYIMIKKFYKDIVIIADKPDGFVLDLAYELCSSSEKEKGHKVVFVKLVKRGEA